MSYIHVYTIFLYALYNFCSVLPSRTPSYLPIIIARDRGNPPLSAECSLTIQVYEFRDTLTIPMTGNVADFNAEVFAEVLSNILGYKITVADVIPTGSK